MGIVKEDMTFSEKHRKLVKSTEKALSKLSSQLIAETKANNSYIVVSDKDGKVKKIPAKDL